MEIDSTILTEILLGEGAAASGIIWYIKKRFKELDELRKQVLDLSMRNSKLEERVKHYGARTRKSKKHLRDEANEEFNAEGSD